MPVLRLRVLPRWSDHARHSRARAGRFTRRTTSTPSLPRVRRRERRADLAARCLPDAGAGLEIPSHALVCDVPKPPRCRRQSRKIAATAAPWAYVLPPTSRRSILGRADSTGTASLDARRCKSGGIAGSSMPSCGVPCYDGWRRQSTGQSGEVAVWIARRCLIIRSRRRRSGNETIPASKASIQTIASLHAFITLSLLDDPSSVGGRFHRLLPSRCESCRNVFEEAFPRIASACPYARSA